MKMKKSTWLLLVLALVAIFLVAGCTATTPTNGEEPNGEEPPVTPPTDTACPEVVSTKVTKTGEDSFKIVITFNEDFDSSCIENPAFWTITVANPDRLHPTMTLPAGNIDGIAVDGKVVTVRATVVEVGTAPTTYELVPFTSPGDDYATLAEAEAAANALIEMVDGLSDVDLLVFYAEVGADGNIVDGKDKWEAFVAAIDVAAAMPTTDAAEIAAALTAYNTAFGNFGFTVEITQGEAPVFEGLICNKADIAAYEEEFGLPADTVKYADKITWKLENCAVYDELGNVCCEFSDEACCVEPYCEECPEPEEWCDPTEPGACL